MGRYLIKRLLYILFIFFIVSVIQFSISKLVPGDPALNMIAGDSQSMKPEQFKIAYDAAVKKLNLDKPVYSQYFSWLYNTFRGDFGYSTRYKQPVSQIIGAPMMNTVKLNILSTILVFAITIPLGISIAVRKRSFYDNTVQVFSILGFSLPGFIIALIFIYFFAVKLNIFPISGIGTPGFEGTGFEAFLDSLRHMSLPVLTMVFSSLGSLTRYVRATMIEALRMDYIRTARAKGLREKVVIYSHAFRNSLIPLVTVMTYWFIAIFGGSVVIERMFVWNGMGNVLILAVLQNDYAIVLTLQMFYCVLALVANLIMDLLYALVDPRVRLG